MVLTYSYSYIHVLWLQCVCMITTGAISISKMMMVNHSLQLLNLNINIVGDDGISAIAEVLGSCKINELNLSGCGITFTGARLLAATLSSNHTIRVLYLWCNLITVEGALLIMKSAVHNKVCQDVGIDDEYINDEVKKMMIILEGGGDKACIRNIIHLRSIVTISAVYHTMCASITETY